MDSKKLLTYRNWVLYIKYIEQSLCIAVEFRSCWYGTLIHEVSHKY